MPVRSRRALGAAVVVLAAAVGLPSGVSAYRLYRDHRARSAMSEFVLSRDASPEAQEEAWRARAALLPSTAGDDQEAEGDDARRRMLLRNGKWGTAGAAARARFARIAREEAARWEHLLPRAPTAFDFMSAPEQPIAPFPGGAAAMSWVNLGPTDARFQWNGTQYLQVDSGRSAGILVDPADPQIVYFATSGGGIWKTFNFGVADPTWHPITETLGNIAIGAMDLDPSAPETLHVGLGDAFDLPGGQMVKTTTGGASWGPAISLGGQYPAGSGGLQVAASNVRAVRVDPNDGNHVLVATDVGLFRSLDGGATYALVDLPNSGTQLAEATWSIVYTGVAGGQSHFAVSGVYACAAGLPPPQAGYGVIAGGTIPGTTTTCTGGNLGDVWLTTNGGASWTSRRAAGQLATPRRTAGYGRLNLAAGAAKANPLTTVLYVQAALMDDTNGIGLLRSTDGGQTFTIVAALGDAVANQTTSTDCDTVDVNDQQAWYNSAIAVDPGNDNNVLVGGMLCGIRTTNGLAATPTWENVSHWLPTGGGGNTSGGTLPYVHADWHRAAIVRVAGTIRALAGTDGGLFVADNLFSAAPASIVWSFPNRGMVTHLSYSVASGDPAYGNAFVAFTGLQDNGTRFRDSAADPTTFNQVIGGDGIGATVVRNEAGATVYWGSVNGSRRRCVPGAGNQQCNQGGAWLSTTVTPSNCNASNTDANPFFIAYAPVQAAPQPTALTITDRNVYKNVGTAGTWTKINPSCFLSGATYHYVRAIRASVTQDGLFGAALSGGRYVTTVGCTGTACTWNATTQQLGLDLNANGTLEAAERVLYTSDIDFPPGPTGRAAGQDFVVSSQSPGVMADGTTPLNPAVGLVFKTQDGGATWSPIGGQGGASPLPLVPVNSLRFDPGDTTNQTLYAGTDLGVYRTTDGGASWHRFGVGLPLVKVTDMFIGKAGQLLRIGTYGRGLWELYPSATSEHGVNGNGDYDRNLAIDVIDLAAIASRLGTTPATTAQPYYDWNVDLTAPPPPDNVNAVDDDDLSALLTRFGDRP